MPQNSAIKMGLAQQKQNLKLILKIFYNLPTKNSCKIISPNEENRKEVIFNSRRFEKYQLCSLKINATVFGLECDLIVVKIGK